MEAFIQPKITGYRQLSEAEVALMNEGKALAEQCGAYVAKLRGHYATNGSPEQFELKRDEPPLDQRWVGVDSTAELVQPQRRCGMT